MRRLSSKIHFSRRGNAEYLTTSKLAREVWLIDDVLDRHQLVAYQEHIKECRKAKDDNSIPSSKASDILELVEKVRSTSTSTLDEANTRIGSLSTNSQQAVHDESIRQALCFAVRLWAFVSIQHAPRVGNQTLQGMIAKRLPSRSSAGPNRTLGEDFCEKNLSRTAGIRYRWTSDLSEHLELKDNRLSVFRHGAALNAYAEDSNMCQWMDRGFLMETQATIDLLFPFADPRDERRRRRISEKNGIDLEVGDLETVTGDPSRDLSTYHYWGSRLRDLEDRYHAAKPKLLKQWYFDRRNRDSFATFWFAFSAFILALVFGTISAVTGIMQVWIAFNSGS